MRKSVRHGLIALATALAVFLVYPQGAVAANGANDTTARSVKTVIVHDPFAFSTAEEMYAIAPTKPFDAQAQRAIADADTAFARGGESREAWAILRFLEPYRMTKEVASEVTRWSTTCGDQLKGAPGSKRDVDASALEDADSLYEAGKFVEASEAYRTLLLDAPQRLDIRNNLALSEMHLGHDLTALIALETNMRIDPGYLPSAINIPAVAERLGQRVHAAEVARETAKKPTGARAPLFNALWYDMLENKVFNLNTYSVSGAQPDLTNPTDPADVKIKQLQDISRAQEAEDKRQGTVRIGLIDRIPANRSWTWWAHAGAIAGFFLLALLAVVLIARMFRGSGIIPGGIFGVFWYTTFWGEPHGWGYAAVIAYLLLFGLLYLMVAPNND